MTTTSSTTTTDDAALKARHRAMWALGDYHAVATEIIADLGPVLVEATHLGPDDHVLDVAAGSGNVAIPAAATGARVIASDLTPELLDQGKADAAAAGVSLEWQVGDAEDLPDHERAMRGSRGQFPRERRILGRGDRGHGRWEDRVDRR